MNSGVIFAVAVGYLLLLPPQFNVVVGGSVIPPYRFFLIASLLYVVGTWARRGWQFVVPDYLMVVAGLWIWLAFYITSEFNDFFTASVAQTADIVVAYFFARSAFRSLHDLRLFLLMMAPGLAVIAAVIVVESVTKTHIIQPFFSSLLGTGGGYTLTSERLGLLRAAGPFPHPILAGVFFASFLPLYWLSGLRAWPRVFGIAAALASFFTVSSAALLAFTMGAGLIFYNWLTERIANVTWQLFFIVFGLFAFAAELGTKSGTFNLLVRFGSLNSDSAFYRTLIWRFGTQNVVKNPWFGIGYSDWERPVWMGSSIDHYWLLMAIQFGLVTPVLIGLAIIWAIVELLRNSTHSNLVDKRTQIGLAIAMASIALGAISVSMWLAAQVWFHMLMGLCVSMSKMRSGNMTAGAVGPLNRSGALKPVTPLQS